MRRTSCVRAEDISLDISYVCDILSSVGGGFHINVNFVGVDGNCFCIALKLKYVIPRKTSSGKDIDSWK